MQCYFELHSIVEGKYCFTFTGHNFTAAQLSTYHEEGLNAALKYGEKKNELRTKNIYESVQ